jgi:hypothetical protein
MKRANARCVIGMEHTYPVWKRRRSSGMWVHQPYSLCAGLARRYVPARWGERRFVLDVVVVVMREIDFWPAL